MSVKISDVIRLFQTGKEQIGRLLVCSGIYANSSEYYLRIYVLGENPGEKVAVYGVKSYGDGGVGRKTYGWLHEGPWKEDFDKILDERYAKLEEERAERKRQEDEAAENRRKRMQGILDSYKEYRNEQR